MILLPDFYFKRVWDIEPAFLIQNGIRAVLLDIDGTLAPDGDPVLPAEALGWLSSLREAGLSMAVVSNNSAERVVPFAEGLGLRYVAHARKPLAVAAKSSFETVGASGREVAVIGDQIYTDMLFARLCGCQAVLVEPMSADIYPFVRFKRLLERPVKSYMKRKGML